MNTEKNKAVTGGLVARVIGLFDKAYAIASDPDNYGSEASVDAENLAFEAAANAGWNWENDEAYCDWALKATDLERITEGKRRFIACNPKS